MPDTLAYIALGSNLGEPLQQLRRAKGRLTELGDLRGYSSIYRTAPVGGPAGQADFLNAVIRLRPELTSPEAFLETLFSIELAAGRERSERWGARSLDLDILSFGDLSLEEPGLSLPHPRMMWRAFVLAPLVELEPSWRHPVTGEAAAEALQCLGRRGVERTDLRWK